MRSKWLLTYWIQLVLVAMCWAPAHAANASIFDIYFWIEVVGVKGRA
jgi:hypothetical protein